MPKHVGLMLSGLVAVYKYLIRNSSIKYKQNLTENIMFIDHLSVYGCVC
jgi:hypothetical protein